MAVEFEDIDSIYNLPEIDWEYLNYRNTRAFCNNEPSVLLLRTLEAVGVHPTGIQISRIYGTGCLGRLTACN